MNTDYVVRHGPAAAEKKLRRILGSVRIELTDKMDGFRILGPDTRYHRNDPYLIDALSVYDNDTDPGEIRTFKTRRRLFDLCFEDSWTGYFVAEFYSGNGCPGDLILIHLDDHTDMMSTLLDRSSGRLEDPATRSFFDPATTVGWETAIEYGSVGIGNFVTALYQADFRMHVRHLNNFGSSTYRKYDVECDSNCHTLIPGMQFATIRKKTSGSRDSAGSYLGGTDPERVLTDLPDGRVIVHVDLDYLINDFNGNPVTGYSLPNPDLTAVACSKLDSFFDAMSAIAPRVDRWIVATSPGFCSAFHWPWLLAQLEERIEALGDFGG